MAKKAQLTESLPKLAVSPTTRQRVNAVADAAEVSMADVVRDCIENTLPSLELQFGLVDLDDLGEDALAAFGLQRTPEPVKENRAAGCFGGPPGAR